MNEHIILNQINDNRTTKMARTLIMLECWQSGDIAPLAFYSAHVGQAVAVSLVFMQVVY